MINRILIFAIVVLGLSACGTSANRQLDSGLKTQSIELKGFSIDVIHNRPWVISRRIGTNVQLVTQGRGDDETYGIQIWSLELQEFKTDEAFLAFIRDGLEKTTDSSRFVEKQNAISVVNTPHGQCIRFNMKHEDLAAKKRTARMGTLVLRLMGMSCRHPKKPSTVAYIMYSHRSYPEDEDQSLPLYAKAMFESIKFKE